VAVVGNGQCHCVRQQSMSFSPWWVLTMRDGDGDGDGGGGKRGFVFVFGYEFCLVTNSGKDQLDQSFVSL